MAKLNNYNGSIDLISGIRQKNDGEFALAEANAIQVDENGKRLDAELEDIKSSITQTGSDAAPKEHTHKYADITDPPHIPEAGTATPKVASGSGSAGSGTTWSKVDHVHPVQTSVSGNAGTATKLANKRSFSITGGATAAAKDFDGSGNVALEVTSVDGSKITGTIPLSAIPKGAQEKLYAVADDTARLALTSADVQNGDVVKVESNGLMYYVVDETKLGTEAAFEKFTAGAASSVPWTGVEGRPGNATQSAAGLMSATDKAKLDNVEAGANKYTHPSHTSKSNGLYKVTVDSQGHVSGTTAVSKSDITGLGIPAQDTTYNDATQSTHGLMSTADKKKLDGVAENANNYIHPTHTAKAAGFYKVTVNSLGHVTGATAVSKSDITALGIPAQDTVYTHPTHDSAESGLYKVTVDGEGHVTGTTAVVKSDITALGIPSTNTTYSAVSATGSNPGLMSVADKAKLDTIAENANAYVHPTHASKTSGLYKITVDGSGHVSGATAVAKSDITGLGIPAQDTVYTHPSYTAKDSGLYKVTVDDTGHISSTASVTKSDITGLGIPAHDTTYEDATTSAAGLMTAAMVTKLNGIATGANKYTHPSYTSQKSGLYKITVDASGHVSAVTAVAKSDITGLGIPAQDTTYSNATTSTAGLMSTTDKSKLDGIASGANKYVHPTHDEAASGLYKVTVDTAGHVTDTVAVAKSDITALGIPAQDTVYTHPGYTARSAGLYKVTVDASGHVSNVSAVTKSDITNLGIPGTNTVYTHPAHTAADEGMYKVTVDAEGHVTDTVAITKSDITGLGIPAQDTVYTHPSYNTKTSGLYKITIDATGHVSAATAVVKSDITALGIPSTNTTYNAATTSAAGLMSAADKTKLDGLATVATSGAYADLSGAPSIPTASSTTPKAAGTAAVGTGTTWARADHVHPLQTTVSGNAGSATKLANSRNFSITGGATAAAVSFNGTGNVALNVTAIDGSKITGTIPLSAIPKGAQERMIPVADDTARLALTSSDAQNGDVVKVESTGIMYYIVDDTKLGGSSAEDAFSVFTAGAASSVAWSGITDKPSFATVATSGKYSDLSGRPSNATTSAAGFMSASDKSKLDGIASGANAYTHPSYTAKSSGLYKITVDASGHVSATTAVAKADITALGIPSTNTTYSNATTSTAGLMSTTDKSKLDGIASGANKYTHPAYSEAASGLYKITVDETGHVSAVTAVAKADITALGIPSTNTTYSAATTSANGLMSSSDKSKLNGIASGAEVNQNAYAKFVVGSTTITADAKQDSLTLVAGSNVTLTPDADSDSITISSTNTTYSNATTGAAGLMSASDKSKLDGIASGANKYTLPTASADTLGGVKVGSNITNTSGVLSLTKANVTAALGYTPPTTNTTYSAATTSAAGLMSAADKSKLDGIASGANAYSLPTATGSVLGGVKVGSNISVNSGTISLTKANVTAALGYTPPTTNTTYGTMGAATSSAAGSSGLVPAPAAGKQGSFLRGDGTWATPTNTTYTAATTEAAGLMSASDKSKLDGIASGANKYTLPNATGSTLGGVKVGSNITVSSGTISLTKANVTSALGYTPPTTNTTYSTMGAATSSAAGTSGLVPAPAAGKQASFLRGDGTWATPTNTNYYHTTGSWNGLTYTATANGGAGALAFTIPTGTSSTTVALGNHTHSSYAASGHGHSDASTSAAGFMTAAMVTKLNGIATGANKTTVDSSMSSSSTNPVQNKVVNSAIAAKATTATYTANIGTSWSGSAAPYTQTITVSGVLAADNPIIDVVPSSTFDTAKDQIENFGKVYRITTAANSITVYATEKTDVTIPIQIKCVR